MANQPLGFGNKNTADVRLHLIDSAGEEYLENPLLLHSQVLKKAEFFETKLSQRWSSDKGRFEIKITCSCHPENYIKCIQLMYSYDTGKRFNFSNVDEVLPILSVASEVMCRDCMESCMRYLCAVRWSPEQEAQLRILLLSLQINILPDLAARLGLSQHKFESCGHIKMVKESLQELLSLTRNGSELYRSTVEKHIIDYFEASTSPAVKDACRDAILKEFNVHVEGIKCKSESIFGIQVNCSTLSWLIGAIQNCDENLFEEVFKMFCEDADLRNAIVGEGITGYSESTVDVLTILIDRFLKALAIGEIITSLSLRVDFLTRWAHTMVKLIESLRNNIVFCVNNRISEDTPKIYGSALERGVIDIGDTLPLVEQRHIHHIWKDTLTKNSMSASNISKWWAEKLHDAIIGNKII